MIETPEEFEIFSDDSSIKPRRKNEGTNSFRFALLANLGLDLRTQSRTAIEAVPPAETFEDFGFSQEVVTAIRKEPTHFSKAINVVDLNQNFPTQWDPSSIRKTAWEGFNQNLDQVNRLALLTAGLCSQLERESVTAASAILTSVAYEEQSFAQLRLYLRKPPPFASSFLDWAGNDKLSFFAHEELAAEVELSWNGPEGTVHERVDRQHPHAIRTRKAHRLYPIYCQYADSDRSLFNRPSCQGNLFCCTPI